MKLVNVGVRHMSWTACSITIRFAGRRASHRLERIHRLCLCADAFPLISVRSAHPDLGDTTLYFRGKPGNYPALAAIIGGSINEKCIREHWDEILRLAASIKQGTVTASLLLRKLGSYPRQNGLAGALHELSRIERTLFILGWLQSIELRRRVHAGLNKSDVRNALARAAFFAALAKSEIAVLSNNDFEPVA